MNNIEISNILSKVADILDIKGANKFKIRAYRRAAQIIEAMGKDINEIYKEDKLEKIPGVGKSIAQHIKELIKTGRCKKFKKLEKQLPRGIAKLTKIEGVGPKKVRFFYKKFNVTTIKKLEKLIKSHKLSKLKGWGPKSEERILYGIKIYQKFNKRFLLGRVYFLAKNLVEKLRKSKYIDRAEICGSIRRMKETIGDMDILIIAKNPAKAIDYFMKLPEVKKIELKGPTKIRVVLKQGPETDLRVLKPESFGAAFHYFTGSKAHNIAIRKLGIEKKLKINEYGVFKKKGKKFVRIGGRYEEDVFKAVGLPWIPPEIRRNLGEIEAAQQGKLPQLIKQENIRGDLHMHTEWTDGTNSILEMANACKKRGYEYLAITDHGSSMGMVHGLNSKRILQEIKEIKEINKQNHGIKILTGVEVDILPNGKLYLPDNILEKLNIVIAGVHNSFRQPKNIMTERIIKAMRNPNVDIIAHPTGRILGRREPYALDIEKIIKTAKETGTVLEINAFWTRLDLNDINARIAKNAGVKMVINTDSHNQMQLDNMFFGVETARRGWIEKKDVINAWPLEKMLSFLKDYR